MAKNLEPHTSSIEQVTVIGNSTVASTTNRVLCIFAANCGPTEPKEIANQTEFLKVYTDGSSIKRRSHRSFFHALKHAQAFPLLCVRVTADKVIKGITNKGTAVYVKGDKVLNYASASTLVVTLAEATEKTSAEWVIKVGDLLFCTDVAKGGTEYQKLYDSSLTVVSIDPEYNSWGNDIDSLVYFFTYIKDYVMKFANMVLDITTTSTSVTISNVRSNKSTTVKGSFNSTELAVATETSLSGVNFVIAPKYPSTTNIFDASITDVKNINRDGSVYQRFNLNVSIKGETSSYLLSSYPDDIDASGSNMYLTSVNELTEDFCIIPVLDSAEITSLASTQFGATDTVTTYDQNELPLTLLNEGIALVEELEGVRISILSDCGLAQPAYQKKLTILAESLKAIPALSTPDESMVPLINRHVDGCSIDSSYCWWGSPWHDEKALVDFPVAMSPVCDYIERISVNAAGNQEFAPVYGKLTGVATGRSLHAQFNLAQRNELMAHAVNPVKYSKVDNIAFFTNNLTGTSQLTVLQEEQTRRLINKIRYEVDLLCDSFLSLDWDEASCELITSSIKNYFTNQIKTMLRTIEGDPLVKVSLNGLNKVKVEISVKPKGSIKYINVYYNILSMAA